MALKSRKNPLTVSESGSGFLVSIPVPSSMYGVVKSMTAALEDVMVRGPMTKFISYAIKFSSYLKKWKETYKHD